MHSARWHRLVLAISTAILLLACQFRLPSRPPATSTPAALPATPQPSPTVQVVTPTLAPLPPTATLVPSATRDTPTATRSLPTATPPSKTPTTTATFTASPTPRLPDAGPLPAIWTELDLSSGNPVLEQVRAVETGVLTATYPSALAYDERRGRVYALAHCASASESQQSTCIAVMDARADRLLSVSPIPSGYSGRLLVSSDALYLYYPWDGALYALGLHALDQQTLTASYVLSDVLAVATAPAARGAYAMYAVTHQSIARLFPDPISLPLDLAYDDQPIDVAASAGQIFLLSYKSLRVFDAGLHLQATLDLAEQSPRMLALDAAHARLYVGCGTGLQVYDIKSGKLVAAPARTERGDSLYNIGRMVLADDGARLFVLASQRDWFATAEVVAIDVSPPLDTARWPAQTLLSALEGYLPDLIIDPGRARLLVASADDDALIPIDLKSGQVGQRLPLAIEVGEVVVDEAGGRLYVSDSAGWVHVLDRRTYAELGRVYGGRYISLDAVHRRLYAGDPRMPAVTVFETGSLAVERTIPQPGKPRADPAADQVVIVNRRFYLFDGASGQPRGVWLSGVGEPPAECSGCYYTIAREAIVDAQRSLTATITYTPWPGKPGPSESIDYDPATGRAYYALTTGGYVYYSSITIYPDLAELERRGQRVIALDGLAGYIALDPSARRLYVARGDTLYILDSETLNRIGQVRTAGWEPRIAAIDGELGRLYAPREGKLAIWTRQGAAPPSPLSPEPAVLTNTVSAILPSPAFATDQTLLATIDGHLCRSTDGGQHWMRLRGGLPESDLFRFTVNAAFSPDYANDRAMFAAAFAGDSLGAGVYCSTDGGQTWVSCSDGLYDLRAYRIVPSPAFAQDRTLLAFSYTQQGQSVYRTSNGGHGWQLVMRQTGYNTPPLTRPEELLSMRQVLPQFQCDYEGVCQRSDDGGKTWKSLDTRGAMLDQLVQYALSPNWSQDHIVYFMTRSDLYRYQADTGAWSVCASSFFGHRDYTNSLSTLAVAATGDGAHAHDLFVGSSVGELRRFAARDLTWAKVEPAPTRPALTPIPTPCAQSVDERFGISADVAARMGCAEGPAIETWIAWQAFEKGTMLWRQDLRLIYALPQDGAWTSYPDTWAEGQPERDPTLAPPSGRYQPIRGFGKVWRDQLGGLKAEIGWATAAESGSTSLIQPFVLGLLLKGEKGVVYAIYSQGKWETITP